eukprot:s3595_g9.t1
MVKDGSSLRAMGCILAWLAVTARPGPEGCVSKNICDFLVTLGSTGNRAVYRHPKREAFPLRLGDLEQVVEKLGRCSYEDITAGDFVRLWSEDSWTYLAVLFCNSLHGCRGVPLGCWRRTDVTAISSLRATVQRSLHRDAPIPWSVEAVEKELSSRFVSYTGEEIPKMEPLCLERILPALPPKGHGGSIPVKKGATRTFLLHPELCKKPDTGQSLPKLQAKVHIVSGEELGVARALVERGICTWRSCLAFNLVVSGNSLKKDPKKLYALSCCVLPMGWSSAVSAMQEISESLLREGGLPASGQVAKTRPLPSWLSAVLTKAAGERLAWWDVYLDNFFSGEKSWETNPDNQAAEFHALAGESWARAGVLSSEKKRLVIECYRNPRIGRPAGRSHSREACPPIADHRVGAFKGASPEEVASSDLWTVGPRASVQASRLALGQGNP